MQKVLIIDRCYDCKHYTSDPDRCWYKNGITEIVLEDPNKIAALCPLPDAKKMRLTGKQDELIKILDTAGFKTVSGYNNVMDAIKSVAGSSITPLCSGYGIFPDGKKCPGCEDCFNPAA